MHGHVHARTTWYKISTRRRRRKTLLNSLDHNTIHDYLSVHPTINDRERPTNQPFLNSLIISPTSTHTYTKQPKMLFNGVKRAATSSVLFSTCQQTRT
ncbi:hypothetical protein G7K_5520-t1 [Saitoella complicata NRRL Y-17804]|uniref:Uncharacterized protein n=1 Tax=Saitoella complicata (strain BCRC 22490 / CBS 7301 / JCM 7358 / NBRC 10748 / NRRL Y-17804) TaxID=698492 RepID=A0A0E9NNL9_SAICN|nr:hypothetical protein G7K_5520-t1 [Saitoella complicata NRRL Y-17804]